MSRESHIIKINSKDIYYELINKNFRRKNIPVLVFLHEGLGSTAQWRNFPEELSQKTNCAALVYDRYGYGKSQAINEYRTSAYMPDEAFIFLPELLKKIAINEKIILVGHSDGGTIALLFASQFQEKTLAVITEADHVICEKITLNGVRKVVKEYENGGLKKLLTKFHQEKTNNMFYSWSNYWLQEEQKNWHIKDYLTSITATVLAIQGKDDRYGSVKQLAVKLEHIKGQLEIIFISDCGHVPHFEAQNEVLNKMSSFIFNVLQ